MHNDMTLPSYIWLNEKQMKIFISVLKIEWSFFGQIVILCNQRLDFIGYEPILAPKITIKFWGNSWNNVSHVSSPDK